MAIQQELADLIKELGKNNSQYSDFLPSAVKNSAQSNEGNLTQSELGKQVNLTIPSVFAPMDSTSHNQPVDSSGVFDQLLTQLSQWSTANREHSDRVKENTNALLSNKVNSESSMSDAAKSAASTFANGLGLSPILSGLVHLFTGSSKPATPPPLVKYELPTAIRADAGLNSDNSISLIDRNLQGNVRSTAPQAPTQVIVQIQALDSRSILDRSDDIAKAVREAMLHSSALNDVIQDL